MTPACRRRAQRSRLVAGCSEKREVVAATTLAAKAYRVDQIVAGGFLEGARRVDTRMTSGLSEAKLREGWEQFQSEFGRGFDEDGKIAGLFLLRAGVPVP